MIDINYNLYDLTYGNHLPIPQLFLIHFKTIPSKFRSEINYNEKIINHLKSLGFKDLARLDVKNKYNDLNSTKLFSLINEKSGIIVEVDVNKVNLYQLSFFYSIGKGELDKQIDLSTFKPFIVKHNKKVGTINLVKSEHGSFDVEEYSLKIPKIPLELSYGKEFKNNIHPYLVNKLNQNNISGLVLFHGVPGSGKSNYLKYLSSFIKDKEILYIPPSIVEMLADPTIIPFLMSYRNSIIIIEDGEKVIADRENNGSSAAVSNILNLSDGILGDCLNIQIIITFNMKKEKIDEALLRKGRIIVEHKFTELSVDESNNLLRHLNKDYVTTKEMTLADIYNVDSEVYKVTNKRKKIGF